MQPSMAFFWDLPGYCLFFAAIGIYRCLSTMCCSAIEIGTRIALGAQNADIPRTYSGPPGSKLVLSLAMRLFWRLFSVVRALAFALGVRTYGPPNLSSVSLPFCPSLLYRTRRPALRATRMNPSSTVLRSE